MSSKRPPAASVDVTDSLDKIAAQLRAFRDARDWQALQTPRNLAVSVAVECGELLEHFQWVDSTDPLPRTAQEKEEIAGELADISIYLVQLANALEISLPAAIAAKIELNGERYPIGEGGRARTST
jgi:dCTP diphosphatase